jgi:Tfp pilus assembly protein PilF
MAWPSSETRRCSREKNGKIAVYTAFGQRRVTFVQFRKSHRLLFRNRELERARFYVKRVNSQPEQVNAQSLWLQLRIERKLGNSGTVDDLAMQMRRKYPQAPETQSLDAGRYDE